MSAVTPAVLFDRHEALLNRAIEAIHTREYWSPYSENLKKYPEELVKSAPEDFKALCNQHFELEGPATTKKITGERSPYGLDLGTSYDQPDMGQLVDVMHSLIPQWRDAGPKGRVGVCMEILQRLNDMSPLMGHAVMHTSGQGFMMAFQAGAPHAQDRALEAVVYGWDAMNAVPATARWNKPQGKMDPLVMDKKFTIVPRGVAVVIGCSTFPTWNTYPGLFASLVTGNPVIVKPHPAAILPAALTVKVAQEVLKEAGLDPQIVSLAVDTLEEPVAKDLVMNPKVKVIDYTGSSVFGNWIEQNALHAKVFTEKAGVNSIIVDSVSDLKAVTRNLAFTLSLYSGQMCTTTQAIYVPKSGIDTPEGKVSFDEFAQALATATSKFLGDNDRACMVLGAIQSEATAKRIDECRSLGEIVLDSESRIHAQFPDARIRTPLILKVDGKDQATYSEERFGPISFLIATESTEDSMRLAKEVLDEQGAITLGVYSTSDAVLDQAEELAMDVKVALSCNLDGGVFVNQSAAFSDFHATGGNPAANACLSDAAFLVNRFVVVQSRRHV
ncbi:phenylacetic acid degradation protein PaaN [Marinospirillum insulare]|uniref:Phenylacetic acid degradation oxidoreductase n=1 Tax=Marinospirillum insulare TaxID=217169 RepID=A0ABQ6A383_9GAMM|nr:phenylacetic acid degradation protein PaaN [Marinospirillum insulare]GLR64535.1 phenylacetic acid degradation oxidoreductase [Marinospirillum insulare]